MRLIDNRLIFAALACYRLSKMVAEDDGPMFIFKRLRHWANDKAYSEITQAGFNASNPQVVDRWYGKWHNLSEGLCCPYCVGVWLSLPLFLMVKYPTRLGDLFLKFMSVSAIQALMLGQEK